MIYLASDHAGYQLKKFLAEKFTNVLKLEFEDLGPKEYKLDDDFPDFAIPAAKKVASDKKSIGIFICGSGHGMCLAANKVKGVRAILGYSTEGAELGRREEDANVLCLAARIISNDHAFAIVKHFLETKFENIEKRIRRLDKISELE